MQEAESTDEVPVPTLLDDEGYDHICIAEPPRAHHALVTHHSKQPRRHQGKDHQRKYCRSNRNEGDTQGVKLSPLLFCSSEQASPTPPVTPLFMSSVVLSRSLSLEPPPLELLPATPPAPLAPPPPRTSSTEPLGGVFCPQLDHPCVVFVVKGVLCC